MSAKSQSADGHEPTFEKNITRRRVLKGTAAAGTALAVGAGGIPTVAAQTTGRAGLNFDSQYVPDPYFEEATLTRAKHLSEWGLTLDDMDQYEDDNGDVADLGGYVPLYDPAGDEDTENVVTLRADKIEFSGAYEFPRDQEYDSDSDGEDDTPVRALEATHWSTTDATTGTIAVTDADQDVEYALSVESSSLADGETVKATFDLTAEGSEITQDVLKRFAQGVLNVESLGSNAVVEIAAIDNDGDEKVLSVDPGGDTATADVIAASTGNGIVYQQRLEDVSTVANGDGNFDSITKIEIRISASGGASDASITLTAFDWERKSDLLFGSYLANEGTDDEEVQDRVRPSGSYTVTSLDTVGDVVGASDTIFYDVETPFRYTFGDSPQSHDYQFEFKTAGEDYPGYDYILETHGKREVPTAIDLQHSALTLIEEVEAPSSRYLTVQSAEDVTEDVEFEDLDDTDWRDHGSSFDSQGAEVELDTSVTAGYIYGHHGEILLTESNREEAEDASVGKPPEEEGLGSLFWGSLMGVTTAVVGWVAWARRKV